MSLAELVRSQAPIALEHAQAQGRALASRVALEMRSLQGRRRARQASPQRDICVVPVLSLGRPLTGWRKVPQQKRLVLVGSLIVLGSLMASLVVPGFAALSAWKDYQDLKTLGESGIHHLLAAKDDLSGLTALVSGVTQPASGSGGKTVQVAAGSGTKESTGSALDPAAFKAAQSELAAAQRDFHTLRGRLNRPDWVLATAGSVPGITGKLAATRALADVGDDASTIGVELFGAVIPMLDRLHNPTVASGETELLTQADVDRLTQAGNHTLDLLSDVQVKLSSVSFNDLPLDSKQKAQIAQIMTQLPMARTILTQGMQLVGPVSWLLGVGQARHFLVQTLDRSELRPSGGFEGNYGVLTLQNGKLDPFSLYNVNDIDYGLRTNGWIFGKRPPAQYSWWPFANWGLRDANLSPDFPTSAKLISDVFRNEGGGDVDGLIQISPVAISHVLNVTGPVYVQDYNETITAANLEDKIHFYQQDPRGIAIEARLNPNDHTHSLRKRFTQLVVQLLQDKVKHLATSQFMPLGKQFLKDLQAKDIQVYFANAQLEKLFDDLHATGGIETAAGLDGYFLVQTNVSVAKLTPYVTVTQNDDITLDDNGGATHHLVMTFNNNPTGPIYGYPTYRNYVRVYVPEQAQLKHANGFDTNVQMCWAPGPGGQAETTTTTVIKPPTTPGGKPVVTTVTVTPDPNVKPARFANLPYCAANPYPSGALVCPRGHYGPGTQASSVFGSDGKTPWALDYVGAPPATTSDVPNRTMWGGYVVVPQRCTATVTLDYYVPNVVAPAKGIPANASPYSLLIQRQGGTFYPVTLTVHPSPSMAAKGKQTMTYSATISDSTGFTFGKQDPIPGATLLGVGSIASLLK